jgi:hypothetical protein
MQSDDSLDHKAMYDLNRLCRKAFDLLSLVDRRLADSFDQTFFRVDLTQIKARIFVAHLRIATMDFYTSNEVYDRSTCIPYLVFFLYGYCLHV